MDQPSDRPSYEPAGDLAEPTAAGSAKLSGAQRLVKVFTSPTEVFEDIRTKPTWVLALLATMVVVTATSLVVYSNIDFEASTREAIERFGFDVPDEVLDRQIDSAERRWFLKPVLNGVVVLPLMFLAAAGLFFLMMKMVGSEVGFLPTYSTMLHAYWPGKLVYSVLLAILAVAQGPVTEMGLVTLLKSSVAAFLPADAPLAAITFASFIDIFRIWGIVLLVVGLAIVGRVSRGKAAFATLVPWFLAALVSTGLAWLPSLFAR
jgi:hypothetical protein